MDITPAMQSLLEKLDAMELTEGERTAFGQLFGAEEESEVEGFGVFHDIRWEFKATVQGFELQKKQGSSWGFTIGTGDGTQG